MRHSVMLSLAFLSVLPCHAAVTSVTGADGITATIDEQSARYEVRAKEPNWVFAGTLGAAASDVSVQDGQDRLGAFRELSFRWKDRVALRGSIRTYVERPVLLFAITSTEPNSDAAVIRFPRFTEFPKNLHGFSYVNRDFAPPSFALEQNATPWLLYDDQVHATVLSPAANYMIASMHGDGKTEIASGLNEGVAALPAGFTHLTLMALGVGVNATWDSWGSALTGLQGVQRPGNDADIGLRYLGYWTDHGAEYYYDYDRKLGYAGTLEALVQRYRAEGIPIRYLQLDSWWYYKTYTDADGTTGKPKNEGLPLIAHNRWIDPASPYHQRYRISGFAALDPDWWREIIGYLSSAQVVTYEQDWLNVIYERSPELAASLKAGDAFSDGMARAAQEKGLSMQYSMALPRQFLQGTRYGNLTTIRVSGDHFGREKWDTFLYTSRLASALGIWPWCDVFMSRQTDNLLLATLSAGMVGIGDRIGAEDKKNLLHAVRTDGVIVKPDTPLVPLDAMYTAGSRRPMIAAAHTDHGALRTGYVFSYGRAFEVVNVAFTPAQVGVPHDVYVYDARKRTARRLAASDAFTFVLASNETAYFVVAPVARAGIALLGDEGKFVPDGRKRIATHNDEPDRLTATVMFAPLEQSVRLFGYAPRRPVVTARTGSVGELDFDKRTGRFEVSVSPGPEQLHEGPAGDPVRQAIVSLRSE